MAVIRTPATLDNTVSYVATLAFFCCVSCVTLMLKFGGFKASLNFFNEKRKSKKENSEIGAALSVTGAYRTNRDEFFGYNYPEVQRKITPSIVPVTPTEPPTRPLRQVKSTSDLIKNKNLPPNLQQDYPGVSKDPRGAEPNEISNNQDQDRNKEIKLDAEKKVEKQKLDAQKKLDKKRLDEEKKLEKQRLDEQKKRDKLALQEQAKQEQLRKEREKKEAQQAKQNKKKKKAAPQRPIANTSAQATPSSNPLAQGQMQYSTNTLESSISKTSGPPPYSDIPIPEGEKKRSSNVIYSKPIDTGSWDMISEHRQHISRQMNTAPTKQTKQTMMDLKYKIDEDSDNRDNSEV